MKLCFIKYVEPLKHADRFLCRQCRDRINHGSQIRETTAGCFFYPFLRISVSAEDDLAVLRDILNGQVMKCSLKIICFFQNIAGICESLCSDGIDHNGRMGDRIAGTYHTEFKFIIGKCER